MSANIDIRGDGVSPTLKTSRMSVYLSDTGITTITTIITISITIVITIITIPIWIPAATRARSRLPGAAAYSWS